VGEFIFSTIVGLPISGRPTVADGRARATLAIFWAKTRMGWKEVNVHEHMGVKGAPPIGGSLVRARIPKPPEDLAAEPIGNASRTRRVPAPAQPNPARIPLWLFAPQSLALRPARKPRLTMPAPFDPHSWHHPATV
jgi:hypothetical protein